MSSFIEITPKELQSNPFKLIGKDWMLITVKKALDNKVNTMTAAWGGFGFIWGKDVVYIVIRPQRYTKEFVDTSDYFSLTFFEESFKETLSYLGTKSGRDEDKIKNSNLTISYENDIPYFKESNIAILCKKLYAQDMKPECFIEKGLDQRWYPESDHHTLYIAEIEKVLIKE